MKLNKYSELPDSMTVNDLVVLFDELLDASQKESTFLPLNIAEALDQLADRQWHTYTMLDEKIKGKVEMWIQTFWEKDSLEFTELVTSIVGKLGLTGCIPILEAALKENLPEAIKTEINEALREYGQDIGNPYSGLS